MLFLFLLLKLKTHMKEQIEELCSKWNSNNEIKVDSNDFFEKQKLRKVITSIGESKFIENFPIHIKKQLKDGNNMVDCYEYSFAGLQLQIISIDNTNGKFRPQKFFEFKNI